MSARDGSKLTRPSKVFPPGKERKRVFSLSNRKSFEPPGASRSPDESQAFLAERNMALPGEVLGSGETRAESSARCVLNVLQYQPVRYPLRRLPHCLRSRAELGIIHLRDRA